MFRHGLGKVLDMDMGIDLNMKTEAQVVRGYLKGVS
jgi:hypothetical protein